MSGDDFYAEDALGMADQGMFDDALRVSNEDDELRHAYLADATVLLDDTEVLVTPVDDEPFSQREYRAMYARQGYRGARYQS